MSVCQNGWIADQLKKKLAEQFPTDIEGYIEGKSDFLLEVLRSTGESFFRRLEPQ